MRTQPAAPTRLDPEYRDELLDWAEEWRKLAVWSRPIDVPILWEAYGGNGQPLGFADYRHREIWVFVTGNKAEDMATVLHEMAHMDITPEGGHGPRWRRRFALATEIVTGERVPYLAAELGGTHSPNDQEQFRMILAHQLDRLVVNAIRTWLWWGEANDNREERR